MKHFFTLITALFLFSSTNLFAHVRLLAPVDGVTSIIGGTVTISWQIVQDHGDCTWDLYFSSDGGSTWNEVQVDMEKSQLSLNWTVPDIATTNAKIKIIQDNATGTDYEDVCEAFSITTGNYDHVKMLSPISGIVLTPTEVTNISWESFQDVGLDNWDLYLSTDDGATWSELQMNIEAGTMYYKWTIPDVATTTAKIKVVYDNSGTVPEAISEAFTINGSGTTSIGDLTGEQKRAFSNYPNPFSQQTNFSITIKQAENVLLELYSVNGLKLETILDKKMAAGEHTITWNAANYSKGLYFCKMKFGESTITNKLMIVD